MIIGVLSDSHGRVETVEKALAEFRARAVEVVIHCGDIDDATTVQAFAGWTCHFVYGNCDSDRAGIRRAVESIGGTIHDPFGHLELTGKQIAWLHGDDAGLKRDLEMSGHYDYLFYGHTHVAAQHLVGKTRVINPGALFRTQRKSCLVLDLTDDALETVVIPA
jgi:putative phosphoesterase